MSAIVNTTHPSTPPTTMPTPTIYHDCNPLDEAQVHPVIAVHDPSPSYETPLNMGNQTAKRYNLTDDSKLNPNAVLAQNAEVKRSGTWAKGAGTFGPRNNGTDHTRKPSLSERASVAAGSLSDETNVKLSNAESESVL